MTVFCLSPSLPLLRVLLVTLFVALYALDYRLDTFAGRFEFNDLLG